MASPTEHKTVQVRILADAQEIGWTLVSRAEAERRRGFDVAPLTALFRVLLHQLMAAQIRVHAVNFSIADTN